MIKTQAVFKVVLYVAFLSVVLDVCSMVLLQTRNARELYLTLFVCKSYLVSLVFVTYASLIYILSGMEYLFKRIQKLKSALMAFAAVGSIIVLFSELEIYDDGINLYTYGSAVTVTYFIAFCFIFLMVYFIVSESKNMDHRRKVTGIVWMAILISAALIQLFNKHILLVGYASCLSVAVLFMKLENPESYIDRDTGLLNQQSLLRYIKERIGQQKEYTLIVLVLDDFYKYMDHNLIEGAMSVVVKYLDKIEQTTAFHNHGMVFTLLVDNPGDTDKILNMLRQKMEGFWQFKDDEFYVRARYYIIPYLEMEAEHYEGLMNFFVTEKLNHTNNRISYMDESWIRMVERNEMIAEIIDTAVEEDRVVLYFQPILDVKRGVFASAEVLVRIISRDGQVIAPDAFIPVAEANGAIVELGEIIFRKACNYLAQSDVKKLGIEYLEINVSAVQSTDEKFAERFIEIMKETGIRGNQINLEITESAATLDRRILLYNMEKLIAYGVTFSLDDFGTGFSNLNYLLDLPVTIVKLDHNMTQAYFDGGRGKLIIETVIRMIREMGLKIVAEGVDTAEQVEALAPEQITYIQGYHFAKPLPENEYEKFLLKNKGAISGNH